MRFIIAIILFFLFSDISLAITNSYNVVSNQVIYIYTYYHKNYKIVRNTQKHIIYYVTDKEPKITK